MKTIKMIVLFPFLAGCMADLSTEEESATIHNGRLSMNRGVVALLDANNRTTCSGAVIACNKILTAEHCGTPASVFVCDDTTNAPAGCYYNVGSRATHASADLAVLTLTEAMLGMTVLPFARSPVNDTFLGRKIMVYGWSTRNVMNSTGRSEGLMELTSRFGNNNDTDDFMLSPIGQFDHYAQPGDSGGPALWLGTIIGVNKELNVVTHQNAEVDVGLHARWIANQL